MHPSGKLFYHTRRVDLFRIYQYLALHVACNGFLSNINIPLTRTVSIRKATVHLLEYLTPPFVLHWLGYIYAILTSDHGITMTSLVTPQRPCLTGAESSQRFHSVRKGCRSPKCALCSHQQRCGNDVKELCNRIERNAFFEHLFNLYYIELACSL